MAFSNLSACSSDLSYSSRICLPGSCDSCTGSSWQVDDCPESCCEPPCCAPSCCTSAPRLTLLCAPVEGDLGSSRNPPGSGSESPGGHEFNSWSRKIPHVVEQLARVPQLLKPMCSRPISHKRSHSRGLDGLKFGLSVVIVSEACGPGKKIVTKLTKRSMDPFYLYLPPGDKYQVNHIRYEMARLLKPSTFPSLDEKETFLNMYVQGAALPARIHEESILIEFRFQDLHLGEANVVPQGSEFSQQISTKCLLPAKSETYQQAKHLNIHAQSPLRSLPAAKGSFVNRTEAPESHTAAPNAFQRVDDDPGPETCVISSGSRDPAAVVQRGCVVQAPSGTARPPCIPGEANTFSLVSLPGYRVAPKCSSGAPQPEMPLPQEDVSQSGTFTSED
ncbi:hypothetical protein MJG53_000653 [Ovis ammon polii x Ovis aries]|uniref:Uncharacterized protein n=1 Tax=Ovis ammon polii x Ovis aries TaxID=2918886 RepID=A0ACB9VIP5_9CETA|nr:hypothetical protein MJG53_000653 [Ovis ammon polii x Ovis aries]